jgi:hypothetical protein
MSSFFSKLSVVALLLLVGEPCVAQEKSASLNLGKWLSVSSSLDGGYRETQFFNPRFNTALVQLDGRLELWLPPAQKQRRWGPYLRVAGIAGSQSYKGAAMSGSQPYAWQNSLLAGPGFGLQVFPLSGVLGPLRVFGEYDFTHYWGVDFPGQATFARPRNQTRAGFDYWKAVNVNAPGQYWWVEVWNGLFWQSSNEFTDRYDSVIFGNSVRFGVRKAKTTMISNFSPYVVIDSSLSKYHRSGLAGCFLKPDAGSQDPQNPCDFFWENRLLVGGGVRFAPSLGKLNRTNNGFLSRFVVYGEYLYTATYYGPAAPPSTPRFDVLIGVSADVGDWYK